MVDEAECDVAEERGYTPFKLANAGLRRVLLDDHPNGIDGDVDMLGSESTPAELLGDKIALRDRDLLLGAVALDLDELEPVPQSRLNLVDAKLLKSPY